MPGWWNGRHKGLKIPRSQGHASSTLAPGTKKFNTFVYDLLNNHLLNNPVTTGIQR
jgi:hypothetical protein